jgi:hypothetical protein
MFVIKGLVVILRLRKVWYPVVHQNQNLEQLKPSMMLTKVSVTGTSFAEIFIIFVIVFDEQLQSLSNIHAHNVLINYVRTGKNGSTDRFVCS